MNLQAYASLALRIILGVATAFISVSALAAPTASFCSTLTTIEELQKEELAKGYKENVLSQWRLAYDQDARKGVTLLLHGLNNNPLSLDAIAYELNVLGYDVLRPVL